MPIVRNVILAMALSGMLAGLAGAVQVTGVALDVTRTAPLGDRYFGLGFSSGYGFDSIAVALLGRSSPIGVVLAALLLAPCAPARPRCSSTPRCRRRLFR